MMKKIFYSNTALTMALVTFVSVQNANAQGLPSLPEIPQAGGNFQSDSFVGNVPRTNVNIGGGMNPDGTVQNPPYVPPSSDIPTAPDLSNVQLQGPVGDGFQPRFDDNGFLIPDNVPSTNPNPGMFSTGPGNPGLDPSTNYVSPYSPMDPDMNMQQGSPFVLNNMNGQQSAEESPIPGGPTQFERAEPELPVAGETMSLSGFDEFYNDLMGGVEQRLGELTTDQVGVEQAPSRMQDVLPNASVDDYSNDLDKLSAVQREIRMLQLRLQQAQLAKEVYDTIYPDKLEVYEERITELEAHIIKQDEEKQAEIEKVESEKSDLEFKMSELEFSNETLKAEIDSIRAEYEEKIEELELSLETAEDELEEAESKLESVNGQLEYLGGAGPEGGTGTFSNADGQLFMGPSDGNGNPLFNTMRRAPAATNGPQVVTQAAEEEMEEERLLMPGVSRIFGMAGRYFFKIDMPDGSFVNGSIGTILPNGMEIVKISGSGVEAVLDGERYELYLGAPERENPPPTAPQMGSNNPLLGNNPGLDLLGPNFNPGGMMMNNGMTDILNNANNGIPGNIVTPIAPPTNFGR